MTTNELKLICSNISGTPFDYFQKGYETLLKELKDKGIIKEWYYNGEYHFEPYFTKDEIEIPDPRMRHFKKIWLRN